MNDITDYARRINIKLPSGGRVGFSVEAGVSLIAAKEAVIKGMEQVALARGGQLDANIKEAIRK